MVKEKNRKLKWVLLLLTVILLILVGCRFINTVANKSDSKFPSEIETTTESELTTESETVTEAEKMTEYDELSDGVVDENKEKVTEVILPEYTYTNLSQIMYTTDALNVRHTPAVNGEKIGELAARQKVQVTGICNESGWYRIHFDGEIGFVSGDYMVDELPSSWVKELDVAQKVSQIIVVTADKTGTTDVNVSMHTKDINGFWNEDFSTSGKIGRNGLGKEKEGDGKTPIGMFTFTSAFGILPNPGITAMPYLQVDETHHWVDDSNSKYYNKCVSTRDVSVDWNSSEHLARYYGDYNYSLSTSYNEACIPWVGCAIFLHCTDAEASPTSGCIAIPEKYMIQVMINLQKDCIIIIDYATDVYNY